MIHSAGICIESGSTHALHLDAGGMAQWIDTLGLEDRVGLSFIEGSHGGILHAALDAEVAACLAPGLDTLGLRDRVIEPAAGEPRDLEREILIAMLLSPLGFRLPSLAELRAAVRIRMNIVHAAQRTALAFDTEQAERPEDDWVYAQETGFTVRPDKDLITALVNATQPGDAGKRYSFSCYRATEYILLLAIAQELASSNPELMRALQRQWEIRAIMSGEFHEVFLTEYGTLEQPLPLTYFVPGDRVWFRNPDMTSANAEGYEGSWVFYLGGGLFTNFWKPEHPYTLESKCLELFHWRDGAFQDRHGVWRIDESVVAERVERSYEDPEAVGRILAAMQRVRDPRGVYRQGGCMDATRECARLVCPGSAQLMLPDAPAR
jgi:hypothetical protein